MGKWFKKQDGNEIRIESQDDCINIFMDNNQEMIFVSLTYQEFENLASYLGFKIEPEDYRKTLSYE